jgi:hypothetical protein
LLSNGEGKGPLEWFPTYRPQTKCSPKPKPGTVKLATYLMRRYPGSGSLGISRSCRDGGTSEHKEGRAFDWAQALNAHSARDRRYARDFLHRIRMTDRHGNKDALARRMGIMYAIWNDRMYSATYHYRTQRYLNAGCKRIRRCPARLRHLDHMHISLTRVAAAGNTSWYGGHHVKPAHKVRHHKPKHPKFRHHKVRHHKARHHRKHHARHHVRHRHHHKAHRQRARHHLRHHRRHHAHRRHR